MKYTVILILSTIFLSGCALSGQQELNNNVNTLTPNNNTSLLLGSDKLDLSNQQLKKVLENVFGQTGLKELDLSNNQLTGAIQAEIRYLQSLRVLNVSNNLMTGVPAEIGQLQNLEILDLSNNQLIGLPYELGNLKNLKMLNLSGNDYSTADLEIIIKKLPATVEIIK